ncbi:MAG: c-type cytochrome [Pseudomonadota bacterium]
MKHLSVLFASFVVCCVGSTAFAEKSAHSAEQSLEFKRTAGYVEPLSSADAKRGESKAATCAACHGTEGKSVVPSFPKLAGQGPKYIYKQLQNMKSIDGEEPLRPVPQMAGILPTLSDQDMADLALYFSQQKTTLEGVDPEWVERGKSLYLSGDAKTGVPACVSCHGPEGRGVDSAGYPALSGQHVAYIEAELRAFRAAGRGDIDAPDYRINDGESMMMRQSAKNLSDQDIRALANYISGLY